MFLWRIRALESALRAAPLTPRQCLSYLIGVSVLVTLANAGADWTRPWDRDRLEVAIDSVTTVIAGAISIFGLWACFRANGGNAGQSFPDRVLALGFVLAIRFVVFSVLLLALWFFLVVYYQLTLTSYETLDLLFVLVVAVYWLRLRIHILVVARQ